MHIHSSLSGVIRYFCLAAAVLWGTAALAAEQPTRQIPPAAREIRNTGSIAAAPQFWRNTDTLDPMQIAKQCWEGYLTQQPEPWGMTAGLKPTLRFHFDNRVLPWAVLRHHAVDGFDNNARNVGAHALLRQMFGVAKEADPGEDGQMAYLLGCTDPESGFPYSLDKVPRHCALGHGELAKNLILLSEQKKDPALKEWVIKMLGTLRRYAAVEERPGIGKVAFYRQGGIGGQGGFNVGEPPVQKTADPTIGGWQHLYVGWAMGAFSKWHEVTGDAEALDFAVGLGNRLCHSEDPNGDDGSFRSDGSFGGKRQESNGSWHMHGHTHCLPGLVHLGGQLIRTGQREAGVRFVTQAGRVMDWLYDPSRNPDAGSMTGWLGEWLGVAMGLDRQADCEGCTMGDVTQTACQLGAASRLDPGLASLVAFYDRAEQIYTGQVMEQMFRVTPRYLEVMKECLTQRVNKELTNATMEGKAQEIERRYAQAAKTAQRMTGQQIGACGFPDWVNSLKSDLDPALPGIHMQGCCADATIRASHAIWWETVTGDEREARVNLGFNRDAALVRVVSSLPHLGELNVFVKTARRVLVRVPGWAQKSEVKVFVDQKAVPLRWEESYVVFDRTQQRQHLTVTYPLRLAEVREPVLGRSFTERWRGNTIVDISPAGKWIPMYHRPELDTQRMTPP